MAFRTNGLIMSAGGKASTTSLCLAPHTGHSEEFQSVTSIASIASAPGSAYRVKYRGTTALHPDANRSKEIRHPKLAASSRSSSFIR